MALISCPECGRQISDLAESCPSCGYPVAKYLTQPKPVEEPTVIESVKDESTVVPASDPVLDDVPSVRDDSEPESPLKKKSSIKKLFIVVLIAVIAIVAGVFAYINLYKIPHDEAVANFTSAATQYNDAVSGLDARNTNLDDQIRALNQVLNAENLPIDEFLLADGKTVLDKAYAVTKDSAPAIPEIPSKTEEINAEAENILGIVAQVEAMGKYTDTLDALSEATIKYKSMIDQYQPCQTEVLWTGIDSEYTILRFVAQITNPNAYPIRDINTEWIAYDKNDAIVGSHSGSQPDIPANGCIYYVGGAGSGNLSGTPARVELKIKGDGLMTNRSMPVITVSNAQVVSRGYGSYDVTADCITDTEIMTANLDGQILVKDAEGKIIDADFWRADHLPNTISEGGKFTLSEYFYDLPAIPSSAEVYVYYAWAQ